MLYPGIWEAMAAIRAAGCPLAFPTNGTLLEENAERLAAEGPTRLWVSLDGPAAINDRQRGRGVFKRVMRGLEALAAAKRARASRFPEVGITYVFVGTPGTIDLVATDYSNGAMWAARATPVARYDSIATNYQVVAPQAIVQVQANYNSSLGVPGGLYRFNGVGTASIDLAHADYLHDTTNWTLVGSGTPTFFTSASSTAIRTGDQVTYIPGVGSATGSAGTYRYLGPAGTLDLSAVDYTDATKWLRLGSNAQFNTSIQSGVTATGSGGVSVSASENTLIVSETAAAAVAVGGGAISGALSGAGADARNIVLTTVNAWIKDSAINSGLD